MAPRAPRDQREDETEDRAQDRGAHPAFALAGEECLVGHDRSLRVTEAGSLVYDAITQSGASPGPEPTISDTIRSRSSAEPNSITT